MNGQEGEINSCGKVQHFQANATELMRFLFEIKDPRPAVNEGNMDYLTKRKAGDREPKHGAQISCEYAP